VGVRIEWVSGVVSVPDTVEELVTDPGWVARCDQVRAGLHRGWRPGWGGAVRVELGADRVGGAR
jgi:hypothetical protein